MAIGAAREAGLLSATSDVGASVITYLESTVRQETDPGPVERTVLALRALGQPVTDVNGVQLLSRLQHLIGSDGSVHNQTNLTTWAILALRSAGASIPASAVHWLERQQDGDGGFNFETGGKSTPSDPDDTGAALEALAAAGAAAGDSHGVSRALSYLHRDQNRDGGFGSPIGSASNTQSTAWALQGLIATGVNPAAFHRNGGRTPLHYLEAMTRRSGEVAYSGSTFQTPVWTTAEVLPALLQQPYPVLVSSSSGSGGGSGSGTGGNVGSPGQPLAGNGNTAVQTQPNVATSIGRLIRSVHWLL